MTGVHPDRETLDAHPPSRGPLGWLGVFLRGMAMGIAELVPGVSGGTIAFITGIYVELVRSIRALTPALALRALRGDLPGVWRDGNGGFLGLLVVGMAVSIFGFASAVAWLLEHREVYLWAFFFGLIVASVLYVGRFVEAWTRPRILLAVGGVAAGTLISNIQPLPAPEHWISTVIAGSIAICAWILPGVSGSFVMLLLGQYPLLVRALRELDLGFLLALAVGCALGLMAFARVLLWLMRSWYGATLAFLCGFMAGSVQKLWPWRQAVSSYTDEDGRSIPLVTRPLSPWGWEALTGMDARIPGALAAAALAIGLIFLLEALSRRRRGGAPDPGFGPPVPRP
jgi:putative membrane protein